MSSTFDTKQISRVHSSFENTNEKEIGETDICFKSKKITDMGAHMKIFRGILEV